MDVSEQIHQFEKFIEEENIQHEGKEYLEIDFNKIARFNPELSELLLDCPEETLKALEIAFSNKNLSGKETSPQLLISNLPNSCKIPLNEIGDQLDKFLSFEGHVAKPSEVMLRCYKASWECPACGSVLYTIMNDRTWKEVTSCGCGRKGKFKLLHKYLAKFQRLEIIEALDSVPDKPRQLSRKKVMIAECLTRKDINENLQPGQRVQINGFLELENIQTKGYRGMTNEFRTTIVANNIIPLRISWEAIKLNSKSKAKCRKMNKKNLIDEFAQSMSPSFEGYELVRKSLILQHVGGKRIFDANGTLEERETIHVLLSGNPGCQPAGSKVLMANGSWENIENIKKGDEVLSPQQNGSFKYAKVLNTTKWFSNENYEVRVNRNKDKRVLYKCSHNHLIPVNYRQYLNPQKTGGFKRTFKNIKASDFSKLSLEKNKHNRIGITLPEIPNFKNKTDCVMDPYSLGIYIGDGMFSHNSYKYQKNCSKLMICTMDDNVINAVAKHYPYNNTQKQSKATSYYFSLNSKFAKLLKSLGFKGKKSGSKFIPREALLSSSAYRWKLLSGLLDSDGYLAKGNYDYITKSKQLAKDLQFLVHSLGGRTSIRKCIKKIKSVNFEGDYYRLCISINHSKLDLKVKRRISTKSQTKISQNRVAICAIKGTASTVYGFTLDSESQWYVTDNFMVTHNSGKTYIARRSTILSPLWQWVNAAGTTKAGLVACVTRDEYGGFSLEVGPLVLADKGTCMVDELDKLDKSDYGMLNNAMNDEQTKITKATVDQTVRTRTSVLATSNPTHKTFNDQENIIKQLKPIPKDIVDRFDIVWAMREDLDNDKVEDKYMARHRGKDKIQQIWSNEQMREYIAYAKRLTPILTKGIDKTFREKFQKLTGKSVDEDGKNNKSHRIMGNLLRWAYAHAKFIGVGKEDKNNEIPVTDESITFAFGLIRRSFDLLGLISQEGFAKYEDIEEIPTQVEVNNYYILKDTLRTLHKEFKSAVPEEKIMEEIQKKHPNFTMDDFDKEINKMKKLGEIFEPRNRHWALI